MPQGAAKVTFTEKDVSFFIQAVTEGRNCMQITARRGPVNEPILLGSMKQFREIYGVSIPSSNSDLVCSRALDRGAVLYINRVVHYTDPADATTITADKATLTLKNSSSVDTLQLDAANAGSWGNGVLVTVSESAADSERFDLRLTFPEQPEMNELFTALTMNEDDARYAVSLINSLSKLVKATDLDSGDPFDGDSVSVDGTAFVAGTDFPLDFNTISNMAAALAELVDALANVNATATNNVVTVSAATAGAAGNSITMSATSAGSNITVSGATLSGGANAVAATGTVTYGAPSNGDTITVGGTTFTKANSGNGTTDFSTIAELTTLIDGLAAVTASDNGTVITITAATAGTAGNAITLAKTGSALTLSGATLTGGAAAVAATGTITFDTTPTVIDNPAEIGPVALDGGSDGLVGLDDDDWIGDSAAKTGFHAFDDIDDAFCLASPEAASPTVVTAGIAYCENREDMVYVCEPDGSVADAATALKFRNGLSPYSHPAFNSSYGAMYFGRPKVRSSKTNDIIDISTVGDVFGVHAYSQAKSEVWFAPAGLQRGRVPNTLGVHYNVGTPARESELDELSDNQINAIVNFSEEGTVVWDENTLQKVPSALQSLHIRFLLILLKKALTKTCRIFLFEPNDPTTWRLIYNLIHPFMVDLTARRAFYKFEIHCDQDAHSIEDAILNTPERIDRGEFLCRIFIQPTRTLKYFGIEAVITKSGADFQELLDIRL